MKMTKDEFLKNIYTRREAEQYLTLDKMAFQHHIKNGNIVPCKEYGDRNAKVQHCCLLLLASNICNLFSLGVHHSKLSI